MLPKAKKLRQSIYLDHAATTPISPLVKKAMEPFWAERFGNPSSLYQQGIEAKHAIYSARATIAGILNCKPNEIIFTAGGTESVNLAIFGITRNYKNTSSKKYHLITSAIEHHAVLKSYEALESEGFQTSLIKVDSEGFINIDELKKTVLPETVLISVMYANNEIGSIQPIAEIGKWLRGLNEVRLKQKLPKIIFHTDACQAAGTLDIDVHTLGVDLLTANGSKVYGPKQTGFLYVKSGTNLTPLIYGGGQEKNMRSGTENVPGIIGLAKALELAQTERKKENIRLTKLRDYFIKQILKKIPGTILNGPSGVSRLPNNINVSITDTEGEAMLLYLDSYGICVSTGSACATQELDPSHVLLALGKSFTDAKSSIRLTLGKSTTKQQLDYVLNILPPLTEELRKVTKL